MDPVQSGRDGGIAQRRGRPGGGIVVVPGAQQVDQEQIDEGRYGGARPHPGFRAVGQQVDHRAHGGVPVGTHVDHIGQALQEGVDLPLVRSVGAAHHIRVRRGTVLGRERVRHRGQLGEGAVRGPAQSVRRAVRDEHHVTGVEPHRRRGRRDEPATAVQHHVETRPGERLEPPAPPAGAPGPAERFPPAPHAADHVAEEVHAIRSARSRMDRVLSRILPYIR
ncbi:hypothetical protein GCM10014719_59470 [Planomonospora parontospora subsp. antibiotica]|nr:hypothetical protein GCM10014719_59470 [Planomonospora parontospora subsp. antibiotica]GII18965.1 hypothetical protein Ppa05_56910 [Planomonospora parontospora subsp. antibiotica]